MQALSNINIQSTGASSPQRAQELARWYRDHGRHQLPWRQPGTDPYRIWISEILLQQTQAQRVIPYYTAITSHFPNIQALARAPWDEFLPFYQGLGYYQRARNMLACAQQVCDRTRGILPREYQKLVELPGIGPYTARAIQAFAYDQPVLAIDTNLRRILGRVLDGVSKPRQIDSARAGQWLGNTAAWISAALMDLGTLCCTARQPRCGQCPFEHDCHFAARAPEERDRPTQAATGTRIRPVRALVILHRDHREYFSLDLNQYQPIESPEGITSRPQLKEWIARTYGLNVAIRPPRARGVLPGAVPVLLVNAQILQGVWPGASYPPRTAQPVIQAIQEQLGQISSGVTHR